MSKIIIVGGSSEIGNAISSELQRQNPGKYSEITRLSTSTIYPNSIFWDPTDLTGVKNGLHQLVISKDDVVVIALGTLGSSIDFTNTEERLNYIQTMYNVNFLVPTLTLDFFSNQFETKGGGRIILLTSSAGFPVLDNNFMYGSAKYSLDSFGRYLQRSRTLRKTKITIVRSGFVQTKLNKDRTPTPFSRTPSEVATLVVDNLDESVVWTPKVFKFVAFSLQNFLPLRFIAEKFVGNSKK
jgi:short-subunit dehydrogenase